MQSHNSGRVVPVRLTVVLAILAAVAGGGCASVDAACLQDEAARVAVERPFAFDDETIAESFARPIAARPPYRLAVVGVERNAFGTFADPEGHAFETALGARDAVFGEVLPLHELLLNDGRCMESVLRVRRAAARLQADAVLVYDQSVSFTSVERPWWVLDLLVLPAAVVPSHSVEASVDTRATLIDVRTGAVMTTARDTRRTTDTAATFWRADVARDLKRDLRAASFIELARAIGDRAVAPRAAP